MLSFLLGTPSPIYLGPNHQRWYVKWKLRQHMCMLHTRFCMFRADFACSVGAYRQKFLRRSSVGSLSRVRCWLGKEGGKGFSVCLWQSAVCVSLSLLPPPPHIILGVHAVNSRNNSEVGNQQKKSLFPKLKSFTAMNQHYDNFMIVSRYEKFD